MKIRIFILISFTLFGFVAKGQQDPMFTRYTFYSDMLQNPASTARLGNQLSAVYRNQWASVTGAPTTIALGFEKKYNQNAGFGINIFSDKIGFDSHTGVHFNYAYDIKLKEKWTMSLGMKLGSSFISSDFSNVITPTTPSSQDPTYQTNSVLVPKAGVGIFIHNHRSFAGFSIPALAAFIPKSTLSISDDRAFLSHHFYFLAGHVFDVVGSDIQIKPSIFVKHHPSAPTQIDMNLQGWYKDKFALGLSYRTGDAVSAMFDLVISKPIILSYAYDYTYSEFTRIGGGAHEIIVIYRWENAKVKIPSIHKFSSLPRF